MEGSYLGTKFYITKEMENRGNYAASKNYPENRKKIKVELPEYFPSFPHRISKHNLNSAELSVLHHAVQMLLS